MSKKMLINASHPEENRVAIVVDGVLSELDIEIAGQEQTKGNIYKAVVVRVETGLQAAFVDYGAEKLGFLQIGEIHPNLYHSKDETKGRPRIADILHRGQEILIQVVKEERGNKGAALTTNLSIPGRYMVLMPDSTTKGVSRKIQDDPERKKLKRTMAELDLPERMGYIVRTAGIGKEKEELKRDFDYLVRLFEGIIARKDQIKAPSQLYQESNLVIRSIRDYFSTEMDEVLIDDQKVFQETKDFFALVMPELTHLVKQHRERRPIFSRYQIEEQIDALAKNQIPLPSGGSIVIDQTEALVAIDVNSGKMSSESGIEATASKTNIEAAVEVGRQLRLRDLGGLVVIDFIDMRDRKHIRDVEQELRKALKDDKAKVTVGRISQFGLMEMSRQRLKPTLSVGSYLECPHCQGKGRVRSAENQAVALLRQIHAAASKGHVGHIEAWVPLDVATDLLNSKRQSLVELEQKLDLTVTIFGRAGMCPGELDFELHKREKNGDTSRDITPVTHANQIESALAAQQEEKTDAVVNNDAVAAENNTDEPVNETNNEEKKSRRRRRRRRKSTDQSSDAGTEKTADQTADTQQSASPQEQTGPGTTPITEGNEAERSVETATEVPSETTAAADTVPAEEKPKRRPRRRPRKRAGSAPTEATPTEETPSESAPAEVPPAEPASTEEKPKRRSRRTSKKAEETQTEGTPTEAAPAEEKPKRRPRRTTKKAEETQTEGTPTEAAPAEDKPKRRPRRTTKKAEETQTEGTPTEAAPAEDKPKRRPRRTTKKAEETQTEGTPTEAAPAEDKPKRRPGRPRKKPVEAATPEAAATPVEEKPKRRPGRPRKKAQPNADKAE